MKVYVLVSRSLDSRLGKDGGLLWLSVLGAAGRAQVALLTQRWWWPLAFQS